MEEKLTERRSKLVGGVLLIVLGGLFLVGQLLDWTWLGLLILPAFAVVLLGWGLVSGKDELLIPGGIFAGLGLGTIMASQYGDLLGPGSGGALFMLSFALGWVLIAVLSALFTKTAHWWALIPGAIIGLIGWSLLAGDSAWRVWADVGRYWPIILIVIGLYVLFFARPAEKG